MIPSSMIGLEPRDKLRKILELDEPYLKDRYSEEAVDAFIWALCGSCRATKGEQSHAIDELCKRIFNDKGQITYDCFRESSASEFTDWRDGIIRQIDSRRTRKQHEDDIYGMLDFDDDIITVIRTIGVESYPVPERITKAVIDQQFGFFNLKSYVGIGDFVQSFHEYLYIEEAYQKKRSANQKIIENVMVSSLNSPFKNYSGIFLKVPDKAPKNYKVEDMIILKSRLTSLTHTFKIKDIYKSYIKIDSINSDLIRLNPFSAEIVRSNYGFRWLHHAVDKFEKNPRIKDIIFPKETSTLSVSKVSGDSPKLENSSRGGLNDQQQAAVKNILAAKCRPAPYIVFGPPGTGKTKTIIEAILQIYENSSTAKILVCANSNSCVNLLTLKILESKVVNSEDFVRIVSSSSLALIPENIREVTVSNGELSSSLITEDYRIIITTCTLAGHLKRFSALEFDYVFIDEAGQATEPETLLPIDMMRNDGLVILSGDPYQLGPYYESNILDRSAFATSLLERLYQTVEIYRRKGEVFGDSLSHYDERYITKLIISYRSDPRVLAVNNKLFYDNELICKNETNRSIMDAIDVKHPLVFHKVKGQERQMGRSTSWWNPEELFTCLYYLKRLYRNSLINPNQIGIISPYRLQNQQFKKWSKLLNIPECKVDTVEAFQGQEREVMIISTVRSTNDILVRSDLMKKMKFLFQPKRFNVTTSRAKWINLAVGNYELLIMDDCWSEYLKNAEQLPKDSQTSIVNQTDYSTLDWLLD